MRGCNNTYSVPRDNDYNIFQYKETKITGVYLFYNALNDFGTVT